MTKFTSEEFEILQKALRCYELDENIKQNHRVAAGVCTVGQFEVHKALRGKIEAIAVKLVEVAKEQT